MWSKGDQKVGLGSRLNVSNDKAQFDEVVAALFLSKTKENEDSGGILSGGAAVPADELATLIDHNATKTSTVKAMENHNISNNKYKYMLNSVIKLKI